MTALIAVEWSQGIEDAWSDVASFVPKFIGFLIILLIGYFVAKLIAKAVGAILERVGFDTAVERGGIKKALERSEYDASDILAKIVFYGLFLIVLQMAFGVFGPNPISDLLEGVIAYLPKVIAAILIIVIAAAIAAAARELIDASLGGLSYGTALANATWIAITWPVGAFVVLGLITGGWLTGFGTRAEAKQRRLKTESDRKIVEMREETRRNESALKLLEAEGWKVRVDA